MSTPASARPMADRNLLFGILALQMDFVTRDGLIRAIDAWVLDKAKPLGQVLLSQQALSQDEHDLLEALILKHLFKHGGDAHKSLAALSSLGSARQELQQIADDDVQASLAHVSADRAAGEDPFATRVASVGTPTSSGQRFRIVRLHAKGGIGEVFVAHDEEMGREVALKQIQDRHADELDSRARFLLEAKITGGLEHPGVVPVYGLGQYANGRPYYAMRFIKGDSLQEGIQRFHGAEKRSRDPGERTLALRQLLGRFVDVCDAVAYAHSRGVLHRDLKPGNVMLGPYGETLVVDWGLSKTIGRPERGGASVEETVGPGSVNGATPTQLGSVIGTPAFMPPEQAAGRLDQLGPASDVYSLGATLYCLLTGRSPFEGADVTEILRRVKRGEFPPPRQRKRDVPAALDAVCLKAMALNPQDRYGSARALADDIEHWLADEPVSAYREPWLARAGRWARRHRPAVAAVTATALVAVLLGGVGAWWLAREEGRRQEKVEATLVEMARLQQQGRWEKARQTLEKAEALLGEGGPADLRAELAQARRDLDLVARLDAIRLKNVTNAEGRVNTATADREYAEAFREAGLEEVGGDTGAAATRAGDSRVRDALVAALDDWAVCACGRERRAWLLEVVRRADPDLWRNGVRDPAVWEDAGALARLAGAEGTAEQSPQLLAALGTRLMGLRGDAAPLLRAAQWSHPDDFWVNFALGNALLKKKPEEAVGYYRAALALRPETAAVHNNIGYALHEVDRDEAIAEYHRAIELDTKDGAPHVNLGAALRDQGRPDEAVTECRKAIDLDDKLAMAHFNLGNALYDLRRFEEAADEYSKAIDLDTRDATAHTYRGNALSSMGHLKEAAAEYDKTLQMLPVNDPLRSFVKTQMEECAKMLALDGKLEAILKQPPAGAAVRRRLARLCQVRKRHYAASRLYEDAFSLKPLRDDDLSSGHRYDAACAAALAAAGQGEDAGKLDDKERARLRKQALAWLRDDLSLWAKQVENGKAEERTAALKALRFWQRDPYLAGLRESGELAKLPEAERQTCQKLWVDVDTLLKKAGAPGKPES